MAVPRQTSPAGLRIVAFALAMGGLLIGVVMPLVLMVQGVTTTEVAPGVDLVLVLFPAIAIGDWILAYYFWRRATPPRSGGGPIVG